jgi:hypothetical protein
MMAVSRVEMSDHNSKPQPPVTSQPFILHTPLTEGEILEDKGYHWSSSRRARHLSEPPHISGLAANRICETAAYWDIPCSNLGRKMTTVTEMFRGFDFRRIRSLLSGAGQAHFLPHSFST